MNTVMLDFETLGNGKYAAIAQIGACYFDRITGEIGKTFRTNVDAGSSTDCGGEIDAPTVYWWMEQSDEARKSLLEEPRVSLQNALSELNNFLESGTTIWSHATFDFVILTESLKRLKIDPKFSYRAARDIRTLMDLAKLDSKKFDRDGVHHDALADCLHQVKYCVEAFRIIEKRRG